MSRRASGPDRCVTAGVPVDTGFATKPELASRMIVRALDGGVPAGWVAADEVYGGNPTLRAALQQRQVGYVLAVACAHRVTTATGTHRADELVARLPKRAWQTHTALGRESGTNESIDPAGPRELSIAPRTQHLITAVSAAAEPDVLAGTISSAGRCVLRVPHSADGGLGHLARIRPNGKI